MEENKTHFFCQHILAGEECKNPNCTNQHIQSATINLTEILRITDYHERPLINDIFKDKFKTRHIIDPSKLPQKPILCCVCYHLIDPEKSIIFSCCNSYCCKSCAQNWKWPDHCPKCGKKGSAKELDENALNEISKANKSFQIFEYRQEKSYVSSSNDQNQ